MAYEECEACFALETDDMFLPDSDGTSQTSPSGTHSTHGIRIPAASISENRLKDIIVNCPTVGKNPSRAQDGCPSIPSL